MDSKSINDLVFNNYRDKSIGLFYERYYEVK